MKFPDRIPRNTFKIPTQLPPDFWFVSNLTEACAMYHHVPVLTNLPFFFFFFFSEVATEVPFRLMHPQPQDPGQSVMQ